MNSKAVSVNKFVYSFLTKRFLAVKIDVHNKQKNLPISARDVKKIVAVVISQEKEVCDEVSVHFVTTQAISKMHKKYFNDASPTDCISFPIDDLELDIGYRILGEVFVCPQIAIEYAQKHGINPYEECTLYIVHGLLHLIGYDDLEPQKKAVMRKAEKKHMLRLKKLNLLLKSG